MKEIKKSLSEGQWSTALQQLEEQLASSQDVVQLSRLAKLMDSFPEDFLATQGFISKRVAILSGYATQFISPLLRSLLFSKKIHATLWESDYGLFEEIALSGSDELKAFGADVVYFCVGTDHLSFNNENTEYERWSRLLQKTQQLTGAQLLVNTFIEPPYRVFGNFEHKHQASKTNFVRRLNTKLAIESPGYVHFNDVNFLAAQIGHRSFRDERLYDLAKTPVSDSHLLDYTKNLAAVCAGLFGRTRKCLVLDLDNTLWGGVIGDDGVAKIEIGDSSPTAEAFKRFQSYVRELKQRGIILAVCSKNEEGNAKEPFLKREDMVLKLEDISCFVANWQPKHQNIITIAKRLNIGLDSLVFVDDNPAEREIVRQNLPEVAVPELPTDVADYVTALASGAYFETNAITDDDLKRTEQYKGNEERDALMASAENYSDYLKNLAMSATVAPFDALNLPRITQLINKTNQFNVTTKRYSEADVAQMISDPNCITRYVKLRDRFGDNGLISVFIGYVNKSSLIVDTWLMSCRVLKRGTEDLLFRSVLREALKRKLTRIEASFVATAKNAMVKDLFPNLGFSVSDSSPTKSTFLLELNNSTNIEALLSKEIFIQEMGDTNA